MSFGCTFISFKWVNPQDTRWQISEQSTVSGQHSCSVAAERNEKRGGRQKRQRIEKEKIQMNKQTEGVEEKNQGNRADVMIVWISVSHTGVSLEACRDEVLWVVASVHYCCWETTGYTMLHKHPLLHTHYTHNYSLHKACTLTYNNGLSYDRRRLKS